MKPLTTALLIATLLVACTTSDGEVDDQPDVVEVTDTAHGASDLTSTPDTVVDVAETTRLRS